MAQRNLDLGAKQLQKLAVLGEAMSALDESPPFLALVTLLRQRLAEDAASLSAGSPLKRSVEDFLLSVSLGEQLTGQFQIFPLIAEMRKFLINKGLWARAKLAGDEETAKRFALECDSSTEDDRNWWIPENS